MKQENRLLETLNDEKQWLEDRISKLPNGYISVKHISGLTYYYLQHREGDHILSEYVPTGHINSVRRRIALRKFCEKQLKAVNDEIAAIR